MNPQCAACKKTVYPMEKLNCLDKIWHKGCFRCSTCGMTLNMKNYKGYNKLPYCAAHYPSTRFTSVADTPENKRLAQNTANQSSLTYHAEYEKQKGTKLEVADDMETIRASKSAQIASEVSYRGVRSQREHQEAHRPDQVIEDARRTPRHQAVGRISDYDPAESNPSPYSARSQMPTIYDSNKGGRGQGQIDPRAYFQQQQYEQEQQQPVGEAVSGNRKVGKISEYDPELNQFGNPGRVEPVNQYNPPPTSAPGQPQAPQHTWQPPSATRRQQKELRQQRIDQQEQQQLQAQQQQVPQQRQQQVPQQRQQQVPQQRQQQVPQRRQHSQQQQVPQQAPGQFKQQQFPQPQVYGAQPGFGQQGMYTAPPSQKQPAYQPPPPQNQPRSPSWNPNPAPGYGQIFNPSGRDPQQPWPSRQVPQQYRNSGQVQQQQRGLAQGQNQPGFRQVQPGQAQQQQRGLSQGQNQPGFRQVQPGQAQQQQRGRAQGQNQPGFRQVQPGFGRRAGPPQQPPVPVGAPPNLAKSNTPRYRAVYDYVAADEDEISFSDGDMIIDVTIIDDGWMEGRNQRTGKYGMLPSNYVEKA